MVTYVAGSAVALVLTLAAESFFSVLQSLTDARAFSQLFRMGSEALRGMQICDRDVETE